MTATVERATRRHWIGLGVLLLPTLLLTVDLGVLWLAVPALAVDLTPTSTQLLWINDAYGFATAPLLIIMGNLGDRFGRRKLVLLGATGFLVASLGAAFAINPGMLIAARALLGVSGAAILPTTLGLIAGMFAEPRQRRIAVAAWVTALSAGIGIGPVLGGILLAHWWWGSLFLVAVPVMLVALATVPFLVPESRDRGIRSLDWAGVPPLALTILLVVYAIKRVGENGLDAITVASVVMATVTGVLFLRRQRRVEAPLINPRMFRQPTFVAGLVVLLLGLATMNGVEYLVPQYLLTVAETSPLEAGLWLVPPAIALAAGAQLTPLLARRLGPGRLIALGAGVAIAGLVALGAGTAQAVLVSVGLSVVMIGLAPITVLGTDFAVSAAPPEQAGAAAAIGHTSYELGLAFGIAVVGSVAASAYRSAVQESEHTGVPPATVEAASDNYAGGLELARTVGTEFADQVQEAFLHGFQAAVLASGLIAVMVIITALVLLRRK